jgi:type IV fimbrial biogenesis protein FimT
VTLIEAMIVIAILAILLGLAGPGLQTWLLNARIRTAAEDTLAGLELARSEAVRRNCTAEFVMGAGAGWTVQTGRCLNGGGLLQTRPPNDGAVGVILTPTPAAATTVTFDALGHRTTNDDASATLTQIDIDLSPTILPSADSRDLRINVQLNGQIRMCDPNVTNAADSRYCS